MLSKKSEDFLEKLRLELTARGKNDEDIDAIEDELRDHLYILEKEGKDVNSITNGSVDEYINSMSKEMPFDKRLFRILIGSALALLMFMVLPKLLQGEFVISTPRIAYYFIVVVVLFPLFIYGIMRALRNSEKAGFYIYGILLFGGIFAFMIGAEFLMQRFDKNPPVLDYQTSFIIGIVLTLVFVAIAIWLKQWILIAVLAVITAPTIIAQLMVPDGPESVAYKQVFLISMSILNVLFIVGIVLFALRMGKKDKNN